MKQTILPGNDPLTEDELDYLEEFLVNRIDEDEATYESDCGVFCASMLDGYLTAIVSGPVTVPPSVWLPDLWGDFDHVWETEEELSSIMTLFMRHMNGIARTLMDAPETYYPIFNVRLVEGDEHEIVDEWCEGYIRAVNIYPELWQFDDEESAGLMGPIVAFTKQGDFFGHELEESDRLQLVNAIPPVAILIHQYWLQQRQPDAQANRRRTYQKIGRNDPCPCGSGKKYKKCCLNRGTVH